MTIPNTETGTELDFRKKHTVCDAMFWDYLQGKLDPAEALLVSTHYHLSPEARKRVNELNACAAVSLEKLQPVAMTCSAEDFFKKCCAASKPKEEECADKQASIPVPKPLQAQLGQCFDGVKWQTVFPGIQQKNLKMCGSSSSTKIMKIDAGVSVPAHAHTGDEITLLLHGAYEDEGETFKAGDINYKKADPEQTHAPRALETCICMVVTDGSLRFPGILGILINPFLRLRGA